MNKKVVVLGLIFVLFLSSGCLSRVKNLLQGGDEKGGEETREVIVGEYGLRITEWKTFGEVFPAGDELTFILNAEDKKDGTRAKKAFITLLGNLNISTVAVGDVKDGGFVSREFNVDAPQVKTERTFRPYARLCYVYKTEGSQGFWVVDAEQYPGELEKPNLSSSTNYGPMDLDINPSLPFTDVEVKPIRIARGRENQKSMAVKVSNRETGFVANDIRSDKRFGTQSVIARLNIRVPTWNRHINFTDSDELDCSNEPVGETGEKYWNCSVTDLSLTRGGRTVTASFNYTLPEGETSKVDRVWATAVYRYCILTDPLEIKVRKI